MWCGDALNQMFPFTERAKQRLESIRCGALTRRLTAASCLTVLGNIQSMVRRAVLFLLLKIMEESRRFLNEEKRTHLKVVVTVLIYSK